jgi:calcineurin-like phosphoesterase family protein
MKNHFIADLHLDHEGVLAMSGRLFRNIVEHNDCMISQCNRYVPEGDRLFILGDVAWNSVDNYLDRLVCKDVHLIWGNHDKNNFGKKFKTAQDVLEIKIGPKPDQHKVFLSHYPHAYWPSSHHGSFHLYGHCHRQREHTLDTFFPGRRSLDVGVDNALHLLGEYRPFNEDEIIAILGNRPGHDPIKHYDEFQAALPKYRGAYLPCGFVPPTPGYAACIRPKGHDGPCGHEFSPKWTAADQAREDARIAEIKRNRPNPPELLDFGGQSRP